LVKLNKRSFHMLILYDYFRSSASYRVRIALNLKKLDYQLTQIHLLDDGGQQHTAAYTQINPQALVPCLNHDGAIITQSLSILEYLEETFPSPALLPKERQARAYVRSIAQSIACDIHPLNNLRVLNYLNKLGLPSDDKPKWVDHWLNLGLTALEKKAEKSIFRGKCFYQDQITFAEICLIPQLFNARRYHFDLTSFPFLLSIEQHCSLLPAFNAFPKE